MAADGAAPIRLNSRMPRVARIKPGMISYSPVQPKKFFHRITVTAPSNMPANAEPMTPFWVLGTIKLDHSTSDMGFSSYTMHADTLIPYTVKTQ